MFLGVSIYHYIDFKNLTEVQKNRVNKVLINRSGPAAARTCTKPVELQSVPSSPQSAARTGPVSSSLLPAGAMFFPDRFK